MQAFSSPNQTTRLAQLVKNNIGLLVSFVVLSMFPVFVAILDGQSLSSLLANEAGTSKFVQGLSVEIFILAVYAMSYDLILGITGLLSFGHAMFFAVGAYLTGVMLKSFGWSLWATLALVFLAGIVQALLFGIVLPRVKGITFALVTLGMASVFYIVIQSRELGEYTGADVGLQGVISPDFLNPATQRLRLYFVALVFMFLVYLLYRRFINSPTGRVCIAIRENEGRAQMLGYNTFYFKLTALTISSVTAALAGVLHTIYQPIVSPYIASLGNTVAALLIILVGGVGTLSGAILGAIVYRLLQFGMVRFLGENASFINGAIYVAIVLFLPYGIVGTWKLKANKLQVSRQRLVKYLQSLRKTEKPAE
jgi:branched-chain amino acid transport system permease protein